MKRTSTTLGNTFQPPKHELMVVFDCINDTFYYLLVCHATNRRSGFRTVHDRRIAVVNNGGLHVLGRLRHTLENGFKIGFEFSKAIWRIKFFPHQLNTS